MDFWRAMLIQGILQPLVEQGHSVWSNACVWSSGLGRSYIYFSEANKVIRGVKRSMNEAVDSYVLENQDIHSIDKYTWPTNRACAF